MLGKSSENGTVAGLGHYGLAVMATLLALIVLGAIRPIERAAARYLGQTGNMDTPKQKPKDKK